jgi:hypothetical protein
MFILHWPDGRTERFKTDKEREAFIRAGEARGALLTYAHSEEDVVVEIAKAPR